MLTDLHKLSKHHRRRISNILSTQLLKLLIPATMSLSTAPI